MFFFPVKMLQLSFGILPACPIDDLALHKTVDVLKLLLSAGQRLRHRRDVQPEETVNMCGF